MSKGIVAFSGDPITLGHIDIVERSLKIFDHVVVGIGENPDKLYRFGLDERKEMAEVALSQFGDRVSVVSFGGLLVDYAYSQGISTIIRGVRNAADADYERMLNDINKAAKFRIDTVVLFANQSLSHVSSSAAKELQKHQGGNLIEYVPMSVKKRLEQKISKQFILGITGEIGAGKSFISSLVKSMETEATGKIHLINTDRIGHALLETNTAPYAFNFRKSLIDEFFSHDFLQRKDSKRFLIDEGNLFLNSKEIGSIIWENAGMRSVFNHMIMEPLLYLYRKILQDKEGLILVESALMADSEMLHLVNNEVILVTADMDVRMERLLGRGYSISEMDKRVGSQLDTNQKRDFILKSIKKNNHGRLCEIDNSHEDELSTKNTQDILHKFIQDTTGLYV